MECFVNFEVDEIQKIDIEDYDDEEFAIAKMGFLSTRPNSHKLIISEEVLKNSAKSVLGKWVVVKMENGDATTHLPDEQIVGSIPRDQEIEFVYDGDGYLRAYVDTVISKIYAKEFCKIFEKDNQRAVSVEMKVATEGGDGMDDTVENFNIVGVTVLGKMTKPSCPESDITFTRFSEDDANAYFAKTHTDSFAELKNFVKEHKIAMEKKSYKIDKSKEAISDKPWGDVDKTELRNKIMDATNRKTIVKSVYMLVEDGWEEAPSEHLKYPVMELKDDTFVYNRDALASALGYAKKENEQSVVNKVEAIYKKLDLELDRKEEDAKMSENEVVEMEEIVEDSKQEEVKDENFAEVEENMAEQSEETNEEDETKNETEDEAKMSEDEMMAKIDQYEKDIADKDNIIMEKEAELVELRKFKEERLAADKACMVETVMAAVSGYMDKEVADSYRQEGLTCDFAEIDGWANKVKASVVDRVVKKESKEENFMRMANAQNFERKETKSVWDRLD